MIYPRIETPCTLERQQYKNIYIVLFMTGMISVTQSQKDGDWVVNPPSTVSSFTGEDLTLDYEYNKDPSYDTPVRFTIGHYVPGRTYEDLLFEGNLDPVTGHIEVKHELYPGKMNVTSYLGGFSVRVGNLRVSDSGQYLVDFRFNVYDSRHHGVTLSVYNRPYFVKAPSSDDVIEQKGSAFEMLWTLTDVSSQPAIDNLQIKHHTTGVSHTLVHQQLLATGQWSITYPDEQLRFKGRLSYAPGPNLERIQINLWELEVEDSGLYTIEIAYVGGVTNLNDSVQLQVASGIGWISKPRSTTCIINSAAYTFNFTADIGNSTVFNPTYELSKFTHEEKRETLVSLLTGDVTSHTFELNWNPNWRLEYNKSTDSMLVTIPKVLATDGGNYGIVVKSVTGNILAYHRFSVIVFNESTLTPKTAIKSNGNASSLEIRFDETALTPYIIVYGEELLASARTKTLNTSISRPQELVVVLVKYDSDGLHYEKRHTVNMSHAAAIGNEHVTDGFADSVTSTASTTGLTSMDNVQKSDTKLNVLLGLQTVVICLLLPLVVMSLYYVLYWLHPRIKAIKYNVDTPQVCLTSHTPIQENSSGYNSNETSQSVSPCNSDSAVEISCETAPVGCSHPSRFIGNQIPRQWEVDAMHQNGDDAPHEILHGDITNHSAFMSHSQEGQDSPSESSRFLQSPDNEDPPSGWTYLSSSPKVPKF